MKATGVKMEFIVTQALSAEIGKRLRERQQVKS